MKLEPSILYQHQTFSVGLLKILVAGAIVLALLCLVATIREVRHRGGDRRRFWSGTRPRRSPEKSAPTSAYQRIAEVSHLERVRRLVTQSGSRRSSE